MTCQSLLSPTQRIIEVHMCQKNLTLLCLCIQFKQRRGLPHRLAGIIRRFSGPEHTAGHYTETGKETTAVIVISK